MAFHFSGDYEPVMDWVVQSQMTSQHVPGAFLFIDTARYKASNIHMNIARVPCTSCKNAVHEYWPEFHLLSSTKMKYTYEYSQSSTLAKMQYMNTGQSSTPCLPMQ